MSDRELLKLAAQAADIEWIGEESPFVKTMKWWNPLENDGDALRLAVKLRMEVFVGRLDVGAFVYHDGKPINTYEGAAEDIYAATRRAIVRAAAEIGKGMK